MRRRRGRRRAGLRGQWRRGRGRLRRQRRRSHAGLRWQRRWSSGRLRRQRRRSRRAGWSRGCNRRWHRAGASRRHLRARSRGRHWRARSRGRRWRTRRDRCSRSSRTAPCRAAGNRRWRRHADRSTRCTTRCRRRASRGNRGLGRRRCGPSAARDQPEQPDGLAPTLRATERLRGSFQLMAALSALIGIHGLLAISPSRHKGLSCGTKRRSCPLPRPA